MHHPHSDDLTRTTPRADATVIETGVGQPVNNDFGPAGYDPASVDAFVAATAERLDELQVAHLRALTELDQLRTRLCEGDDGNLATNHTVHRLPSGLSQDEVFEQRCASGAHVIRTEVDTAHRRAARLIRDAELTASNILDGAKRDAACALQAARAQSATKVAEAQSSAERILQRAHERATELSAAATMEQLDVPAPGHIVLLNASVAPVVPAAPAVAPAAAVPVVVAPAEVTHVITTLEGAHQNSATLSVTDAVTTTETGITETSIAETSITDPAVKQERTFEALWNASTGEPNGDIERYFRPQPFKIAR